MRLIGGLLWLSCGFASNVYAAPVFSKAFSPSTIGAGSVSTLQFTITNTDPSPIRGLAFTDSLPAGMTVASPANASSDCLGALDAPASAAVITFSGGGVGASRTCSIAVDVTSSTVGTHTNVSGDLISDAGNSGPATADLTVDGSRPGFSKSFAPSSVNYGGRSTLTLTVDNSANSSDAYSLSFVDNLPAGMVIASPSNASNTCVGSQLTAPPGGSSISYVPQFGFTPAVAAGATCAVSVDVVANAIGSLQNTTGDLTSSPVPGGLPVSSGKASATLTVSAQRLTLSKSFTNDPVAPGDTVDLSFTVRNLDRSSAATNISFSDDLGAVLAGLSAVGLPISDPCGPGSSLTGADVIHLSGGSLGPESSCTFSVAVQLPAAAPSGNYVNLTTTVIGDVDGVSVTGNAANDLLVVAPIPVLTKQYLNNPVSSNGTTELEFTLTNGSLIESASEISFTDEFTSVITGAVSIPGGDFCGTGSSAFVTTTSFGSQQLQVFGANLPPGGSCTFSLVLQIAPDAASGIYPNITSEVNAVVAGNSVTGGAATDSLQIVAPPKLYKEFIGDPVAPGDAVTLRYTLSHGGEASGDATDISFSDDLTAALSGLAATGLPLTDVCGVGSEISGTTNLIFTGGTLQPGTSCSFDVTLQTPPTAASGDYPNTTSNVVATVAGLAVTGNQGQDSLHLYGLTFGKAFVDDPVLAGDTVMLEFTLSNTDPSASATNITFTDDLDDVISGMTAIGLPLIDVCGAGSSLTGVAGDSLLIFQGGILAPGESCAFAVEIQVPAGVTDDRYSNVTSNLAADIGGVTLSLGKAADQLVVSSSLLDFTKQFMGDPAPPGGSVDLQFTILNPTAEIVTDLSFSDDLSASIPGLVSTSGSVVDVCGAGSLITGTDVLTFTGGSLAAGASCSFTVALTLPADVQLGSVVSNTTSQLVGSVGGLSVFAAPARDDLQIDYLVFSKQFAGPGEVGGTASLSFSIQNPSSTVGASSISFIDDLGAVLNGLVATGLPKNNVCGLGSVLDGTSLVSLSDGRLLPGGSCTFTVDVQIPPTAALGDYSNQTSELFVAGIRAAGPANAVLTVIADTDLDDDGVPDIIDHCPGTIIPENVPTIYLKHNRYALTDGDFRFDTGIKRRLPRNVFTLNETGGCSCEQIIALQGLGKGHEKFGCSLGAMREWESLVKAKDVITGDDADDGEEDKDKDGNEDDYDDGKEDKDKNGDDDDKKDD